MPMIVCFWFHAKQWIGFLALSTCDYMRYSILAEFKYTTILLKELDLYLQDFEAIVPDDACAIQAA
jgi:hypothetical protein